MAPASLEGPRSLGDTVDRWASDRRVIEGPCAWLDRVECSSTNHQSFVHGFTRKRLSFAYVRMLLQRQDRANREPSLTQRGNGTLLRSRIVTTDDPCPSLPTADLDTYSRQTLVMLRPPPRCLYSITGKSRETAVFACRTETTPAQEEHHQERPITSC